MMNPKNNDYRFVFVDRSVNANNDELVGLARKQIAKEDARIVVSGVRTEVEAGEMVNGVLERYEKQLKQPYLVILQADSIS